MEMQIQGGGEWNSIQMQETAFLEVGPVLPREVQKPEESQTQR